MTSVSMSGGCQVGSLRGHALGKFIQPVNMLTEWEVGLHTDLPEEPLRVVMQGEYRP